MPVENPPSHMIWITPKYPLGIPDGARHATCVLLRNLTRLGIKIDLICLLPENERANKADACEQLGLASCTLITRPRSLPIPLRSRHMPLTFRTFALPSVRVALHNELSRLLKIPASGSAPWIIFDGLHTFAALETQALKDLAARTPVIYRAHNVETVLWEQCAERTTTPWMRWLYLQQASLVRLFERNIIQCASLVAPVSEEDAARFQGLSPGIRISAVPIGADFPPEELVVPVTSNLRGPNVLFIGRLDWAPNKNGLTWFLDNVWPAVIEHRTGLTLTVAGVGDSRWLLRFDGMPQARFLGPVEDVRPLYESCALTIAPLFQGSGTRVKILEAARFARPALSTALGAEGSGLVPGESYFQAETKKEWIQALEKLTAEACRETGWNAFHHMRKRLDGKILAERFLSTLLEPSCPL
jgi:glycosyltransferase involved in cell wall biosynthesis